VVSVGGREISVGELQRAYLRQRQLYERLYQGRLNDAMLKQMGLEEQVLDQLVSDRLVELEAKRLGVSVSDDAVARAISTSPEFQDNGRFVGTDEIRRRLDLQGMSEEQFAESLRRQLERESLQRLVGSAVEVSEAEVEREFEKRNEQVKLEYVLADAARFRPQVQPSESEIEARFDAKKDSYRVPEKRVVAYVLLDRQGLAPQVHLTDRDLEVYYQDHREEFRQEEEACASHILIKVKQGEAGEGHPETEAQKIAQGLLDQLKAGADFATLAKKSSEDQGSAQNGGDLGCFPPGRMVSQFDDAAFAMKPGQLSDLVKTSFGYHIIRLASKKEEAVLPLQQVKERVRAEVTERKVSELGDQKAQALNEALSKGRSLQEAASAQGLTVQKTTPFARGEVPPVLASPTLVTHVFQMKPGQTEKEGFPLPQGAAFVSLLEVQPARAATLADVHDKVKAELVEEKAMAEAHALAESVKAKAASAGLDKAAVASGLVRKETPQLVGRGQALGELGTGAALDQVAFSLPEKTLSDPVRTASGWAVLRVLEKKAPDATELQRQRAQIAASLRDQQRQELFRAFLVSARERYTVTRDAKAYRRAIGEREP
ncbi:MAG TPA: peptidylprolyl isomerase, partial [Vicinamibacteria bacterium]|nr:peptidylprolyl isomerase [Vicinamibacteria bacterium]